MSEDEKHEYRKMHEEAMALMDEAEAREITVVEDRPEAKIAALHSLIMVLEGALLIQNHPYKDPPEPEPYPGARRDVLKSAFRTIELARQANLIPRRKP